MMRLPSAVAIIGKGLDLTFESRGKVYEYDCAGLAVCADVDERTLWIWPYPKRQHRKPLQSFPKARALFERWSELEAAEVLTGKPRPSESTRRLGRVRAIGYRSDKYTGVAQDYEHRYDVPPTLEQSGNVLRIRGGRQRITPDGIRG